MTPSTHADLLILMVIRLVAHGDFLLLDALAQLAVCEPNGGNGAAGRLFLDDSAHVVQEPGSRR